MTIMNDITAGNMPVDMSLTTEQSTCVNHTNAEPLSENQSLHVSFILTRTYRVGLTN